MVETILNNQTSEVCPFVSMACVLGQGYNYKVSEHMGGGGGGGGGHMPCPPCSYSTACLGHCLYILTHAVEGAYILTQGRELISLHSGGSLYPYTGEGAYILTQGRELISLHRGGSLYPYTGEGAYILTQGRELICISLHREGAYITSPHM